MFGARAFAMTGIVPSPVLEAHFDAEVENPFVQRLLQHPHVSLAEGEGIGGSGAIRVDYVGFEGGSRRVAFTHALPEPSEAATLVFDVRFDRDFQWTQGGKLHGFGPQNPITGGLDRQENGWSARMMFLKGGAVSSYLYDQDDTMTYGVGDRSEEPVFTLDEWHNVRLQIQLNALGESDGWVRIYVDQELVVETSGVMFRRNAGADTQIQTLMFNTFHGGNDLSWTPVDEAGEPTVVHAYFDNFAVYMSVMNPDEAPTGTENSLEKDERRRPRFSGSSRRR